MEDEHLPEPRGYPSDPWLHEPDDPRNPEEAPVARSIFTLPFRHRLHERCARDKRNCATARQTANDLVELGWRVHPDICQHPSGERRYRGTFELFTPALRSALVNAEQAICAVEGDKAEIRRRLEIHPASKRGEGTGSVSKRQWPRSVILARDSAFLGHQVVPFDQLQFRLEDPTFKEGRLQLWFGIRWSDCWLLDNGVGVLAVCVELEAARWRQTGSNDASSGQNHMRLGALSHLNRVLRDLDPPKPGKDEPYLLQQSVQGDSDEKVGVNHFWDEIVLPWLGDPGGSEANPAHVETDPALNGAAGSHRALEVILNAINNKLQ